MKRAVITLTILTICACSNAPERIIGVKIYDYRGDFAVLASSWERMGVNTAFVSADLAADTIFRREMDARGMNIYLIFPVFFNPEALSGDSSLYAITNTGSEAKKEWVEFVCPSRITYREAMKNRLSELIRNLDPDGVSIDFIRQFVYWEQVYPDRDPSTIEKACYCDSCLARFSEEYDVILPDSCRTAAEKAAWIEENLAAQYDEFRCGLVTSMARLLSEEAHRMKSNIKINLHMVPWPEGEFGNAAVRIAAQDLNAMKEFADYVSPMCYSQMLRREPGWIRDVVMHMDSKAEGMVLPSIQVYPYYIDYKMDVDDFRACLENALIPPSRGVVFFSWPLFEKDSMRMEVAAEVIEHLQ